MKKSTKKNSISLLRLRKKHIRYKLTELASTAADLLKLIRDVEGQGDDWNFQDIKAHTQEALDYLKLAQQKGRKWWRKA